MKILVTGADGQLAKCIKDLYRKSKLEDEYIFFSKNQLNICDKSLERYLYIHPNIDCIINCAGYTNVERCEQDIYKAFKVNAYGVKNLVDICKEHNIMLIHISTDYVYDMNVSVATEDSKINPASIYGQSKRDGEVFIENSNLNKWYIFRTSWLYSEYGNNFYNKVLYTAEQTYDKIYAVTDEVGNPTCAHELATFLIAFIQLHKFDEIPSGIYNFTEEHTISRYEFAKEIACIKCGPARQYSVIPISQKECYQKYNLKVPRSHYCVLSNKKINEYNDFYIRSNHEDLLKYCIVHEGEKYMEDFI